MNENFPKLMSDNKSRIKEAQRTLCIKKKCKQQTKQKQKAPKQIIFQLKKKRKIKKKILQEAQNAGRGEDPPYLQRNKDNNCIPCLSRNHESKKRGR